jgi:D-alanyl-D-alanine carboxypeptidase
MINTLVSLLAGMLMAEAPIPPPVAAMDHVVDAAAANGLAGVVLVGDGSRTLYARAISAPGRPHTLDEAWRWASVTKQFTATLVMQQVEAGRLSLDDTLAERLPAFTGSSATKITLRMLLQHTSGLPDPSAASTSDDTIPAFYRRNSVGVGGVSDALGFCAGSPRTEPGAGFNYNNCDYIVLGAVLERVTAKPFAVLLQDQIAGPLKLTSLRMASGGAAEPKTVLGRISADKVEPPFALATFGPAGAAYGKPEDLLRFDQALLNNRLLSPTSTAVSWKGEPKLGYVALGAWSFPAPLKGCKGPVALVERRGEIGGVEVRNLLAPTLERALIVFADRSDIEFGEIWQGKGLSFDLASAAFCETPAP